MPAGASGVIMEVWADGKAYEVEFESPHVVLTIEGADLEG
jgi:quinol monooxygenase YgiN